MPKVRMAGKEEINKVNRMAKRITIIKTPARESNFLKKFSELATLEKCSACIFMCRLRNNKKGWE